MQLSSLRLVRQPVSFRTTWFYLVARDTDGATGHGECSDGGSAARLGAAVAALGRALPTELDLEDGTAPGSLDGLERLDSTLAAARRAAGLGSTLTANTVVGAVETALADLSAQRAGVPLFRALGATGQAGPVPLYANINRALRRRTPEEFAEVARRAVDGGFRAVKCAPFDNLTGPSDDTAGGLECVRAVRQAVGPGVGLMVDVHHRLTDTAVLDALETFEELDLAWLEDAVHIEDLERIEVLAGRTAIPLAGGELSWEVDEMVRAVDHGLRVVMPDLKHAGGVARARRMAQAVGSATISFHNPSGPVGTLASGHASLACPNAPLLEYAFGEVPWRAGQVEPAEQVDAGSLVVPDGPGLGATVVLGAAHESVGAFEAGAG